MATTKNILFDLGGVLLNINYHNTQQAFKDLGFHDFEEMYTQYTADALFDDLETGKVSADEFYDKIMEKRGEGITRPQVTFAWNNMLLDFRESSLGFLEKLSERYKLFLLSNTNEIHLDAFEEILKRQVGLESLDKFFSKAYYSHRVKLRKPNRDIFEFVLADAGIKAEETLFIDDSWNNIEAAKKLGFKTHLLLPGEMIENLHYEN
ncbi:HAD family phosphatase [Ferruginibacter sp. HRS2-29]|uniref:HAD family hydrolase n=1 Tax=Ferruginibacter sp. HRS2-29 TaxID=2487334 RepID=UPI0020CFC5E0|nr:HAD family phosphatase [Ferruginibacter sp. HRS2-29]MCP9751240.1 HAD family phosphatase [Ferruginibacter sp. HRS2-29]